MISSEHCAAVIPCFNEEAAVARVVAGVRQFIPTVLVVDDGCTDHTAREAAAAGAVVLHHPRSEGKGAALATGWRHARELGFRWALTLDGDGQHAPSDIPKFLDAAGRTEAGLVVGNRMATRSGMPLVRWWVNRWMSARLSRLAGRPLPDTQCGYRLVDLETWSNLPLWTRHFEVESEVLLAFVRSGQRVEFVPVQVIYKSEQSKIRPWRDTVRWFRWLRKARRRGG